MSARQALMAEAERPILIFDGAFGTEVQAQRLQPADFAGDLRLTADQSGNNDILAPTRPDVIADITRASARIAREAADAFACADGRSRFVAGAMERRGGGGTPAGRKRRADHRCEHG